MNDQIKIHFILDNKLYAAKYVSFTPRAGDEVRFSDDKFFLVERLVWIYDEPDQHVQRLNIGLSEIDLSKE